MGCRLPAGRSGRHAGVQHSIRFSGAAELRTLYLDPVLSGLPTRSVVITVSPLLRELVVRAVNIGMLDRRDALQLAITTVILSEIHERATPSLELPQPTNARLIRVAKAILASPAERQSQRALAKRFGIGIRALERGFVKETGLALGQWRRQARFLHAIRRLGAGTSVKAAALDAGYHSASAFIAAFRSAFDTTPARYFLDPVVRQDCAGITTDDPEVERVLIAQVLPSCRAAEDSNGLHEFEIRNARPSIYTALVWKDLSTQGRFSQRQRSF